MDDKTSGMLFNSQNIIITLINEYFILKIGTRKSFLLLKPSNFKNEQNGSSLENGTTTTPPINNPFLKCDIEKSEASKADDESSEQEKASAKQTTNNLFKPASNLFASSATSALSDNSSFVFGQNLHERVVMVSI